MSSLMSLAVYNPAILSEGSFLAGFVARRNLVDNLLTRLGEIEPGGLASHHLILGQRGMGKTSLLRRVFLGVRDDPALSSVLLPLTFREEQYNVHNLHIFWCNCLNALGDWFDAMGQADKAREIDQEVALLTQGKANPEGVEALEILRRHAREEGRRPLLLVDGLDLVLSSLEKYQWSLRRALQEAGGVVVMGASTAYMEATASPTAAFYDFFHVTVLEPLSADELVSCLGRLAETLVTDGRPILEVTGIDPGRIRTLHALTGGNPRTLVFMGQLLEASADGDVMADLDRILDQVTVLYKARVEELPPQARVVLDAVALHWDPMIAADLAMVTGLDVTVVSSQLDRLVKAGVLEKVSISASPRAAFQLGERLFAIWYLMRHGPRRQRARLRWLTEFIRAFYTPSLLPDEGSLLRGSSGELQGQGGFDELLAIPTGRYQEEEEAVCEILGRDPTNAMARRQLVRLLLMQPGRLAEAEVDFESVASSASPLGAALLRTLRSLSHGELGEAARHLAQVFTSPAMEVWRDHRYDLMLVLQTAARHGEGDALLKWMDEQGFSDRYLPVRAALDALLHGEVTLQNLNPEVRGVARWIFGQLNLTRPNEPLDGPMTHLEKHRGRSRRGSSR